VIPREFVGSAVAQLRGRVDLGKQARVGCRANRTRSGNETQISSNTQALNRERVSLDSGPYMYNQTASAKYPRSVFGRQALTNTGELE